MIDIMHRYTMDSQYESVNVADFDVVRSTQFVDDYPRGVRVLFSWVPELVNRNVGNSGEMAGTPHAMLVEGNIKRYMFGNCTRDLSVLHVHFVQPDCSFYLSICTGLQSRKRATTKV